MDEVEDILLQEAIDAIESGQTEQAREFLARLLKSDQRNPVYWLWMSAVAVSRKERIYCLQTVLKIDPENEAARRALTFLGERSGDEIPPFPLDRNISWADDLTLREDEAEVPKGFKGFISRPVVRIGGIGVGLLLLVSIVFAFIGRPHLERLEVTLPPTEPLVAGTPSPTPTPVSTVSVTIMTSATPLSVLMGVDYTPTPLYVQLDHDAQTQEIYRAAITEFQRGDYDLALNYFEQLLTYDPQAVDALYYRGEIYRLQGQYADALTAYNQALELDPNFGPAYLGRARVLPLINDKAKIEDDLQKAVQLSPDFLDARLMLARYWIDAGEETQALQEIKAAEAISPDSAEIHALKARIYLAQEEYEQALTEAQAALDLDVTLLDAYYLLGKAYYLTGDAPSALEPLQLYVVYNDTDPQAWVMLATAYNEEGEYADALEAANRAYELNRHIGEIYHQRALAYLGLGEAAQAEYNFKAAQQFFPKSFEISMGIAHALMAQNEYGNAYQQVEKSKPLAQSDAEWVQFYYWRAYTLEQIDRHDLAIESWEALLEYPDDVLPADWRTAAQEYLSSDDE